MAQRIGEGHRGSTARTQTQEEEKEVTQVRVDIMPVAPKELPVIIDFLKRLYLELGEERSSIDFLNEELLRTLMASGKTHILKAVLPDSERLIGLLTLTETQAIYAGGSYGVIDEMYVVPEHRSDGIGKRLIQAAMDIARQKGWKRLDVTAPTEQNEHTVRFYEQNGFRFTGPKLKLNLDP